MKWMKFLVLLGTSAFWDVAARLTPPVTKTILR